MSALDDRRQAAREAAQDSADVTQSWALGAIEVAIETATRVRITREAVRAAVKVAEDPFSGMTRVIAAALAELGFEVEESAFVCPPWCGISGAKCANPKHGKPDSDVPGLADDPGMNSIDHNRTIKPDYGTPITDHVYRRGDQVGDLCNHVYPIEGDGWPGMRCATPERWHHDRHPQQAPRKDTLPS